jgi:NAD(P)-dependent dehydrogenase (short-subunit alcohol dehydrogenase family)
MDRLKGKVAFIGGATRGIGKTTAEVFAREGAKVVMTGRSAAAGEAVAAGIRAAGGDAIFLECDVRDDASVQRAVQTALKTYGAIHVLFNNAGGSSNADGTVVSGAVDEFWRVITLDLFGTYLCSRHIIPEIIKAGGGAVINNASMAGVVTTRNRSSYCSAKGGVIALTRAMAKDFAGNKVRVNAIAPALVLTERIEGFLKTLPDAKKALETQPLGAITTEEVALAAVYLASDESRSITGHVLEITGGS